MGLGFSVLMAAFAAFVSWNARGVSIAVSSIQLEIANFKLEIANFKLDLEHARANDRDEIKRWINGSFMRASEVCARLESLDEGIKALRLPAQLRELFSKKEVKE